MEETNIHSNTLYTFAYCGSDEGFSNMLQYLSEIAEDEIWSFDGQPNSILRKYIFKTFERCNAQNKILFSEDEEWCTVNTGLLTKNGKDILMVFTKNTAPGAKTEWFLKGFRDKTEREYMEHFNNVPSLATYTDNYEDFYFVPDYEIEINTDHILDDNWDRIEKCVQLPKNVMKTLLIGVIEEAKIKVKRNMRLVVPQYYKSQIMYLLPIDIPISDNESVTMALAIEKTKNNKYRANTIFTKEIAYEKARLLMKPESNWLIE